ncbi:restriction endonuclease subunit S [Enterococcus faecium]|uniref:restriction endonuclease subunit S n=1 Tax=Enterococcus faecium TaxID=1352 RepID=UPI0012E27ADE|nr:restriction endonuclease subunit S [Enterococcus faecium]MUN69928.1 restriction endonuclease subunit S [Enterococcus faecium]
MVRKKIEDLGKVISGGTPSTKNERYWGGDIAWITPKDLSKHNSMFIFKGERGITEEGLKNSSAYTVPTGTVLFSSRAPIGYVAIAGKNLTTNQGFKNIVVNDENDNLFIYYLLKNNIKFIESHANGSTFKEISAKVFKNLEFDVPNLDTQRKISKILSTLDSKIELNNQIISNLEELASALFKRWFVDFEFPDENGNPYKSSGGKMVDSELGEIPEGWKVSSLLNSNSQIISGDWGKENPINNYTKKVKVIRGADIVEIDKGQLGKTPTRYILEKNFINKAVQPMDIIIEISGGSPSQSTGRNVLISSSTISRFDEPLVCTNFCKVIRLKDVKSAFYINDYLKYLYSKDIFFNYENGTTGIKNLDYNSLLNVMKVKMCKDINLINRYYDFRINIENKKNMFGEEVQTLITLRDSLLPKLLSGEIELPEDEEV